MGELEGVRGGNSDPNITMVLSTEESNGEDGFGLRAETELTFLLFPGNRQLAGKSADGQIGWRAGFRISLLGASPPGGACARPFTPRITPACSRCLSRRGRIPGSSSRNW